MWPMSSTVLRFHDLGHSYATWLVCLQRYVARDELNRVVTGS